MLDQRTKNVFFISSGYAVSRVGCYPLYEINILTRSGVLKPRAIVLPKAYTFDNLGNTRLLASIISRIPNSPLVDGLLRGYLFFRLFKLLAFLDARIAHALRPMRCQSFVGDNCPCESSWARRPFISGIISMGNGETISSRTRRSPEGKFTERSALPHKGLSFAAFSLLIVV
jgi:hypothetical protein